MSWIITGTQKLDPDAAIYIDRVEAEDGQSLEEGVRIAYSTFVSGCKNDGIWDAIKASCILAGARTLAGALVPLVGTAPTNYNFVAGDYDRETGLVGDGSTKYLDSNRNNDADPQNSNHNVVWLSTYTSGDQYIMGNASNTGGNFLLARNSQAFFRNRFNNVGGGESFSATGSQFSGGLFGMSRVSSGAVNVTYRQNSGQVFTATTKSSFSPKSSNISVLKLTDSSVYSNARLSFYSIGESLDLALLDTRVTTLMSDLATAIP